MPHLRWGTCPVCAGNGECGGKPGHWSSRRCKRVPRGSLSEEGCCGALKANGLIGWKEICEPCRPHFGGCTVGPPRWPCERHEEHDDPTCRAINEHRTADCPNPSGCTLGPDGRACEACAATENHRPHMCRRCKARNAHRTADCRAAGGRGRP